MAGARYSYGGDEFIFVELSGEMSLESNFRAVAITNAVRAKKLPGIVDICQSNASYQVWLDPDVIHPRDLRAELEKVEAEVGDASNFELQTRIFELPVYYDDPWTRETLMRFRERHQDPNATDLEYAARINGMSSPEEFIAAHHGSPWICSMVGFVAGVPWLYQLVPRERQLEVPKYVRPRTDTPALTIGHGGCFAAIYAVQGAGGYQMFGIMPTPIYLPQQDLPDFEDSMVFFRPGDIAKYAPITREQYDDYRASVEAGTFRYRQTPVTFSLKPFLADPDGTNAALVKALYADSSA